VRVRVRVLGRGIELRWGLKGAVEGEFEGEFEGEGQGETESASALAQEEGRLAQPEGDAP
jgi:hypothetical protein